MAINKCYLQMQKSGTAEKQGGWNAEVRYGLGGKGNVREKKFVS